MKFSNVSPLRQEKGSVKSSRLDRKAAQLLLEGISSPDFEGAAFKTPYQLLRRQSVRQLLD